MTFEEIEARISEIESKLENEHGEELKAMSEELDNLIEERKALLDEVEQRAKMRKDIAEGKGEIIKTEERKEDTNMEERTYGIDSVEYRNAWIKNLQGKKLSDVEARAYASTDTHNAIPTLVADKFFAAMKKTAPMLDEITLMQIAGNVKFVATGTRNAAASHTENAAITPAADTVVTVTLGAVEYVKVIGISEAAEAMSIPAFEGWLVSMLSEDIGYAIDNAIIGKLAAASLTTTTASNWDYAELCALAGSLPAYADNGAKILCNKKTLFTRLVGMVDANDRPIFDGVHKELFGYPVVTDDYVADDVVYLGKLSDIVGNLSKGIEVQRDASSGFLSATVNYRGYAAFDCALAKTDAIVKLA